MNDRLQIAARLLVEGRTMSEYGGMSQVDRMLVDKALMMADLLIRRETETREGGNDAEG